MANTGIDGAKALSSFTNVATKFMKDNTLSKAEVGVLRNMLESMNGIQQKQAMTDLKTYNPIAADALKNAK